MPLSDHGVERRHYHTRDVEVKGYYRADGLWDIEGHIRDTKTYSFENYDRGLVQEGEPVHDMWLRITIDDSLTIQGAEASTEWSPYTVCPSVTPKYEDLVGLRIGPGFHRKVKERLGGMNGCTHITELLYPMATVCYQTAYASRNRAFSDFGKEVPPEQTDSSKRPGHLNGCHAMRVDGPVVKKAWPQFYVEPDSAE